jgi:hypothetical protein
VGPRSKAWRMMGLSWFENRPNPLSCATTLFPSFDLGSCSLHFSFHSYPRSILVL